LFVSASNDPVQTLLAGVATYVPNKGGVFFSNSLNAVVQYTNWNHTDATYPGSPVNFDINAPYPGQYSLVLETSNSRVNPSVLPSNTPASCKIGNNLYHNVEIYVDGIAVANKIDTIKPLATNPGDTHQITRTASFNLTSGPHQVILHWTNDCNVSGSFDSNLAIYNLKLFSYDSDAIGIRIMTNNNHYSPYYWYTNTFNGGQEIKGLNIDDYSAVSEGRTVYANATDINTTTPSNIFGDIFLMSYSQGADGGTTNIYNQMVSNWRFNAGTSGMGGLDDNFGLCSNSIKYECAVDSDCGEKYSNQTNLTQNLGTCVSLTSKSSVCSLGFRPPCLSDSDCQKMEAGYCNSPKSSLVRDTKRLSDVQDINFLLNNYYNQKRCSNDQYRLCIDSQDCYGGGTCSNYYPSLEAGTYIAGRTFSAWPSWQDNLSKLLGYGLPVDPINNFFGCSSPFDSTTCWDSSAKIMSNVIESSSSVYYYKTVGKGTGYELFVHGEYDSTGSRWMPSWESVNLMRYNPFVGYNTAGMWRANTDCGNGTCDSGEDCSTCWTDCGCLATGGATACLPTSPPAGAYSCQSSNVCGDGRVGGNEKCDGGTLCDSTCQCTNYAGSDGSNGCVCAYGYERSGDICTCDTDSGFVCDGSTVTCDSPRYIVGTGGNCVCNTAGHFSCLNPAVTCDVGYTYDSATKKCDCNTAGGYVCNGTAVTCQTPTYIAGTGGTCVCNTAENYDCSSQTTCATGYTFKNNACVCDTEHGYVCSGTSFSCNDPKYVLSTDGKSCVCNTVGGFDCTNLDPNILTCDSSHAFALSGITGNCNTPCTGSSCCRQAGCDVCIDSNHQYNGTDCDTCKPGQAGTNCAVSCAGATWVNVLVGADPGGVCSYSQTCNPGSRGGVTEEGCDSLREDTICTPGQSQTTNSINSNNGVCCSGENFSNESSCIVKEGDLITLKAIENMNEGWVSDVSGSVRVVKNPNDSEKLVLKVVQISDGNNGKEFRLANASNLSSYLCNKTNIFGSLQEARLESRDSQFTGYYFGNNINGITGSVHKGEKYKLTFTWDPALGSYNRYCLDTNFGGNQELEPAGDFGCPTEYQICDQNFNCDNSVTINKTNSVKGRVAGAFEEVGISTASKSSGSGSNLLNTFFVQFLNAFNI
jgi:hypothetical protein